MGKKTKVGKDRKDKFYKLAKETGYRSRAAFKLIQLNRKFGFLQKSQVCVDLCAAPGGWMQVAKQVMPMSSIVIGVDLYPIRPISGCISFTEDITTDKCCQTLKKELKQWKADVVLHDGAPNVGRNWLNDAYQQICLTLSALKLGTQILRSGGWFVTKVFRSKDYNALLWVLKQLFKKVHATKPNASRKESAEIFIVCQDYLAPQKLDPRLLDIKYVFEELQQNDKKQVSLLHPNKQKAIKAEGYTENDILFRNELSALEFINAENALYALQGKNSIIIDDERIAEHPKTTTEILECCKDIKVLGRKDIKGLLSWQKCLKEEIFNIKKQNDLNDNNDENDDNDEKQMESVVENIEEMEDQKLQEEIDNLKHEEQRDLNRQRKKVAKLKSKLKRKINLNMIIKGDEGPHDQSEQDIFNLNVIKSKQELDDLLDVTPDVDAQNDNDDINTMKLQKYTKYNKNVDRLDDYDDNDENEDPATESDTENYTQGLGLNDDAPTSNKQKSKKLTIIKKTQHPLIVSDDYREKNTKRSHRVEFWFAKDNLQNLDNVDEIEDLKSIAHNYKAKGVNILEKESDEAYEMFDKIINEKKRKIQNTNDNNDDDDNDNDNDNDNNDNKTETITETKVKVTKVRLNEDEMNLGAKFVEQKKFKHHLINSSWNRYSFNDTNLPIWFTKDEEMHMRKPLIDDTVINATSMNNYNRKVQELNVRSIKKVMEAKNRKRRQATKRLTKVKKQAQKIIENGDASNQEKIRQLKKIYKNTNDKRNKITYVVAKKKSAARKLKRPAGVKGRYRVVDPRQKKDKRAATANAKAKRGVQKQKGRRNK